MNYRVAAVLLVLVSLLPVSGCDKATPVAPNGAVLTISANPSQISLNGSSKITVIGRKPDGNPLNPGTEVRLSVDKGTITPSIVEVDSSGAGTATFRADGRTGEAKITAQTGGGDAKAETSVQVGQSTDQKPTVLVSVSPNNIPVNGMATVTVIARNSDGTPVGAGQTVILTTTLGSLDDPRPKTKADGTATTTLRAGTQSGTATVSAIYGSSDVGKQDVTIRDAAADLNFQVNPASISNAGGTVTLTAFVFNSQGQGVQGQVVNFSATRGKLDSTQVVTDTTGKATATLTLSQADLSGVCAVSTSASTSAGTSGSSITKTAAITVTGNSGCP